MKHEIAAVRVPSPVSSKVKARLKKVVRYMQESTLDPDIDVPVIVSHWAAIIERLIKAERMAIIEQVSQRADELRSSDDMNELNIAAELNDLVYELRMVLGDD